MFPGVGKGTFANMWAFSSGFYPHHMYANSVKASLMPLSTAGVCYRHVGAYLRLLAITGVCDKHAGASFKLLPAVSVLYQYLGPSLMLHSIAAGLWEYSLDGSFGIFTIAASVFGYCLIFAGKS